MGIVEADKRNGRWWDSSVEINSRNGCYKRPTSDKVWLTVWMLAIEKRHSILSVKIQSMFSRETTAASGERLKDR
ncbi:hypothetical protein HZH66_012439 [Vespula vulgaris]|uniref:Uncharacterized protein n=1 Tax=Vespula vulgaris TaxID=7454 RepID=A0A834J9A0_VESVU|nr:hypothetical protein HZH66_012439 [Vespula vulgaris]